MNAPPSTSFDHQRLKAYGRALDFFQWSDSLIRTLDPTRYYYFTDQLNRPASSIALNVAEGAGKFSPAEKARFYRMGRRSATECAAVLDLMERAQAIDSSVRDEGHAHLRNVISLLVALCRAADARATLLKSARASGRIP